MNSVDTTASPCNDLEPSSHFSCSKPGCFCRSYRSPLMSGVRDDSPPPILTAGFERPDQIEGEWMLVRTLSRHEKTVVCGLASVGCGFFFPYNTIYEPRRRKVGHRPLFEGYLFATTDAREHLDRPEFESHLLPRGSRFLPIAGQNRFRADIMGLHQATASRVQLVTSAIRNKGERVLVIGKHPMHGQTGVVESWQPNGMDVFITVHVMGQSASFNVSEEFLKRW